MARTVDQIKASIYARVATKALLADIFENPSQAKIWGEIIHAFSVGAAVLSQMQDQHTSEVTALRNIAHNADWLIEQVFKFQYSATTPQVVALNDELRPEYPIVDETLQIISVCVLYYEAARLVNVKVAKNSPPVKLSAGEVAALQTYLIDGGSSAALGLGVGFTGVALVPVSLDADYIWLEAEIFYSADFAGTIREVTQLAIVNYYNHLEKDGYLRIVTLVQRIKAVDGVTGVRIKNMAIRAHATAFGSKTPLVTAYEVISREVQSTAGYAYEEVTAGQDLATKLTFTAG
jgi:hypothetical protein